MAINQPTNSFFLDPLIDQEFDDYDYDIGTEMHPDAYVDHIVIGHRQLIERNGTWLSAASYGERHNLSYEPIPVRPKKSLAEQANDEVLRAKYERRRIRNLIAHKQILLRRNADDDWVAQGFVKQDSEWLNLAYEIAFFPHVRDDVARMTAHNWLTWGKGQSKEEGITKDQWIWDRSLYLSRPSRGVFPWRA